MLGLKLPTDPRWVNIVEKNIEEILTDHAYCEQKAASNAITVIVKHPEFPDLVEAMIEIAQEEIEHFAMVHTKIQERGLKLGHERKDPYVKDLLSYICERFRILSEEMVDPDLKEFYRSLMESEARHYTTFIGFARKYGGKIDVDGRWEAFLTFEATLMDKYGKSDTMHG
jgi:tRNA-(ms[2]io[6]A)-hydroxylase